MVDEVKNGETLEIINNEVNEEEAKTETNEAIEEDKKKVENEEDVKNKEVKPKAKPKKQARSAKVVELVECGACNQKMTPKSLRYTHPTYCKGQPRETLPVNKQKASYGVKVKEKLRKEIEEEMKTKYETKNEVVVNFSEPIEVKTKQKTVTIEHEDKPPPRQLTATEILQQHCQDLRKAKQQEKVEKINRLKSSMF